MHYSKVASDSMYLIRLIRGEEINTEIKKFCQKLNIKNASVVGIGSIDDPTLAHYRVGTKKYKEKLLSGVFELTSLIGAVAVFEKELLIHVHVALSDDEMRGFGGHLVKANVSATVELILTILDSNLTKSHDSEIGLKLWDLPNNL